MVALAATPAASAASWVPEALQAWQPGLEMIHAGREEAGFEWILKRQREHPEDACGYYLAVQGYLNYDLGGPDKQQRDALGEQFLERGLDLDEASPGDVARRFCRGALYGTRAAHRVDQGSYVGAAFDGKKMRRVMLDLVQEHPDFVDCRFWLGTYDYYAAVLPNFIKFFRTLLFLPKGDRDRGIAELDEASRLGSLEKYNAHWVLSGVYDEQKQPEQKQQILQRFHAAYPDNVGAARALAQHLALAEPRELQQGVEILRQFIERLEATEGSHVLPRLFDSRFALGRIYFRGHDYEPALSELREALRLGGDDERRALQAGELLISTLNVSGRHAEALEIFREMQGRYPEAQRLETLEREAFEYDEASSRLSLSLAPAKRLAWAGKTEEAEARYKELLREHDGDPQIHLFMAEMYFGDEQWTRSEARFRKVAELAPEMPTFAVSFTEIRLGQICDLTDRRSEAKKHYRKARDTAGPYKRFARAAEHFLKNRYSRS